MPAPDPLIQPTLHPGCRLVWQVHLRFSTGQILEFLPILFFGLIGSRPPGTFPPVNPRPKLEGIQTPAARPDPQTGSLSRLRQNIPCFAPVCSRQLTGPALSILHRQGEQKHSGSTVTDLHADPCETAAQPPGRAQR